MKDHLWEVQYPDGLMEIIDLFRVDYIPYAEYDKLLDSYLRHHVDDRPLDICSLGCGTGHHEINLARVGHKVIGLDRNRESLEIARKKALEESVNLDFRNANILHDGELANAVGNQKSFDAAIMLGVQLSISDHALAAHQIGKHLKTGGIFVSGLWGYMQGFDSTINHHESSVEIAGDPNSSKYAVRLNTYTYIRDGSCYFIDWDSVYLYPGKDNIARIFRRQRDRIEVNPERVGHDPLGLDTAKFKMLPSRSLLEISKEMCLPHTYEYLIGWRKL